MLAINSIPLSISIGTFSKKLSENDCNIGNIVSNKTGIFSLIPVPILSINSVIAVISKSLNVDCSTSHKAVAKVLIKEGNSAIKLVIN